MEQFGSHPDPYIQQRCKEIAARWRRLLSAQSPTGDLNLGPDAPSLSEVANHSAHEASETASTARDAEEYAGLPPRDPHETQYLNAVRWLSDTIRVSEASIARKSPSNKLANYDLQNYDDLMAWVKTFTNMDDTTLSLIKPALHKLHFAWPRLLEVLQNVMDARSKSKARMKLIEDEISRLGQMGASLAARDLKHHVELVREQISEADAARAELKTVLDLLNSSGIWQHVHESLMLIIVEPIRPMVNKAAEQRKAWKQVAVTQAEEIKILMSELGRVVDPDDEEEKAPPVSSQLVQFP